MKKYILIWLAVTFVITSIVLAIVGDMLPAGVIGHLLKGLIFVGLGFCSYTPIKKKFD